jgi:hypothetical protein
VQQTYNIMQSSHHNFDGSLCTLLSCSFGNGVLDRCCGLPRPWVMRSLKMTLKWQFQSQSRGRRCQHEDHVGFGVVDDLLMNLLVVIILIVLSYCIELMDSLMCYRVRNILAARHSYHIISYHISGVLLLLVVISISLIRSFH